MLLPARMLLKLKVLFVKIYLFFFLAIVSIAGAFGQPGRSDSTINISTIRSQYYRRQQDSLRAIFYKEPPYVTVSYYKNDQKIAWADEMTLSLEIGQQKVVLQPIHDNQFLFPVLSTDSVELCFEYKGEQIKLLKSPSWAFKHGATVTFGRIDRFKEMQVKDRRENEYRGHYSTPLEDLGVPYYDIIRDKRITKLSRSKKAKGIIYQVIQPRVYGDGTVLTTYRPLL